ncbi:MAG: hypothetical protein AAF290_08900 [Pseudomonadota bacterium]
MMRSVRMMLLGLGVLVAAPSNAADAEGVIAKLRDAQVERWDGVVLYKTTQQVMGQSIDTYFQRFNLKDAGGNVMPSFHMVGEKEFTCDGVPRQPMTEAEIESWLSEKANASMAGMGDDPGQSGDSGGMLMMQRLMDSATLVGEESIDGKATWHIRAENLDYQQPGSGDAFTIDDYDLWIDKNALVAVRMAMTGNGVVEGQQRDMDMQMDFSDFRQVAGSQMLEPYTQTMRTSGMLGDEEQAQIQEARAQLEEFDREMAEMPAAQRKMMESMMGEQIKMMRELAESGGVTMQTTVAAITVNQDRSGATCRL